MVTAAVLLLGSAACGDPTATSEESALIGGDAAAPKDFPGVVLVENTCTASKVGPRHILLAAHCVVDFETGGDVLKKAFLPGAEFRITDTRDLGTTSPTWNTVTIGETHLLDTWKEHCKGEDKCYTDDRDRWNSPDVALIVTTKDIANIPTATVDLDRVAVGEDIVILGYGCESGTSSFDYSKQRLKSQQVTVAPVDAVVHKGSFVQATDAEGLSFIDTWNVVTRATGLDPNAPGLCPMDSGGPALRASARGTLVVGVNSSYTKSSAFSKMPWTNWHARVDAQSGVGTFLEAHGVQVTHTTAKED